MPYSLAQVLAVGKTHPSYNSDVKYPLGPAAIRELKFVEEDVEDRILEHKILYKRTLYNVTDRLLKDDSAENTFRHRAYTSVTGGGSGAKALMFLTDIDENRKHRAEFGQFLRDTGLIQDGDWLLTTHFAGDLYRSLDLMSEIMENAGATVLSAGNHMPAQDIIDTLAKYKVNVLCGESNQIVQLVHYISGLTGAEKHALTLERIIYTSEVLTKSQRALIRSVLEDIHICSVMGSAEAGPWAVSNPNITGLNDQTGIQDFIYDTRCMRIEIFPQDLDENTTTIPKTLPDGEEGIVVQTSLSRLRNPVIRYNTGDIASIHPLPDSAHGVISREDWQHFRVIRLRGRDRRVGFKWDAVHFEYAEITTVMEEEQLGILQWQLILDQFPESRETTLELRLLCPDRGESFSSRGDIVSRLRDFFVVYASNQHRFSVNFVEEIDQFERSTTGRKIIKIINRVV